MLYPEHKNLHYAEVAQEVLKFWKENKIFEKSISQREKATEFVFYEGPPSANGTPGIHHVMARTIKDIFCRYKTLKGFRVERKGGWDTHGLPVELQVEKSLGITKEDIGIKISIEEYNQKCRETVMMYTDQWNDLTEKMGYWVDLENPYITYENNYIETLWYLLKKLYEKGLLYKGYTVQPYSPAAGTGLSSHELNYPGTYQDVSDTSIVAQFKVILNEKSAFLFEDENEDVRILAWTTTPWTLPSNCALAVGEEITYVKIKTFNPYTHKPISVILAKDLLPKYFSDKAKELKLSDYKAGDKLIPFEIAKEFQGKHLLEIRYEQLMPYVSNEELQKNAFRVIAGDFVTTEDGTGVVHTASVFGADDFRVCKANGVPSVLVLDENGKPSPLVDKKGKFVKEVGKHLAEGIKKYNIKTHKEFGENDFYVKNYLSEDEKQENYKSTDVIISIILKEENKAFKVEKYLHSYPHCWRTGKPVLYYPLDSWFIRTTALKERMVELNKTINWKPESTGTGRFGSWLENLVDWNLSRSRYWGTPLPIWRTEDGSEEKCIGSLAELKAEIEKANQILGLQQPTELPDLHRPYVDRIILVSEKGDKMYREPDLIDVWFDSGAMPYAQWHYPFSSLSLGEGQGVKQFPADFISEGVDQTRGWFFTLHALAVMLFDSVAFKNVVSTGLVLDKNGEKMSKSKGNVINPFETLEKYGADTVRWYMVENANPWDNLKFDLDGVIEVRNKFFGTLHNTYNFFALYANLDKFIPKKQNFELPQNASELDKWIISKLQTTILEVEKAYEDYEPTKAARAISDFVTEHLSNWYVRLSRKRFWVGEMTADKQAAYETLFECLKVVSQMMSPIAPFYADFLYRNLTSPLHLGNEVSVHLTNWQKANENLIDKDLEQKMELAQHICSLTHALRKKEKIKVRQPLSRILIPVLNPKLKEQINEVTELIKTEVNIKTIEFVDDTSGVLVKKIKPNFKRLGEIYKAKMKEVASIIQNFSQADINRLEREGLYEAQISDGFITLTMEDVIIEASEIAGWSVLSEKGLTIALDITVTEELRYEGIAREMVNRLQNLRKEKNLEVADKIQVLIERSTAEIDTALEKHKDYIAGEVQAVAFGLASTLNGSADEVEIDELKVKVVVSKA
ncbi:isoleucine--tRNA ligase [Raineya orbicola]|jgi:isoleucyl-tRNA synthetase|uniref:Isoleucine--tRNA ligase n=1 Tax=Raineya orbicola TaxID=2016530 RepID=A0A2N3IIH4_9BACT|nr:isoleucine--tRNA ligase [Raineya orbicola]PKQ70096.1 ileS: isoleucine--tRNA ligase [Raineya orbicola]